MPWQSSKRVYLRTVDTVGIFAGGALPERRALDLGLKSPSGCELDTHGADPPRYQAMVQEDPEAALDKFGSELGNGPGRHGCSRSSGARGLLPLGNLM